MSRVGVRVYNLLDKVKALALILAVFVFVVPAVSLRGADADDPVLRHVIAFEESHVPAYTIGSNPAGEIQGAYSTLAEYLESLGYIVRPLTEGLTSESLGNVTVLVISTSTTPYSEEEAGELLKWVSEGGSLLILGEWGEFSESLKSIMDKLNATFGSIANNDMLADPTDHLSMPSGVEVLGWLVLGLDNMNREHPMLTGVSRIEVYGATNVLAPGGVELIVTDDDTFWLLSGTEEPSTPIAVALTYGSGRIVILGDSDLFTDEDLDGDGVINLFDSDNEVLARNIFTWLTEGELYREEATLTLTETITQTVAQLTTITEVETVTFGGNQTVTLTETYTTTLTLESEVTRTNTVSYTETVTETESETVRETVTETATTTETVMEGPGYVSLIPMILLGLALGVGIGYLVFRR